MIDYILSYPQYIIMVAVVLLVALFLEVYYWLSYSLISTYRSRHRTKEGEELPAVSVVVVLRQEDACFIENGLVRLLEQDHPQFEVVAVNDCGGYEITEMLESMQRTHPRLKFTTLRKDDRFKHGRKIPLFIGIKAAGYENIIVTDVDSSPSSDKWLSYMCRGFSGGDLVIGYTGFEIEKGFANAMMRSSRLSSSIAYLFQAIQDRAYRGIYNNIGYTRELFFASRGYTHHRMSLGEDDLFVQKVATQDNTSVILNPRATMRQKARGKLKWWWSEQRYRTYARRYYPLRAIVSERVELVARAGFWSGVIAMIVLGVVGVITDYIFWVFIASVFVIRQGVLIWSVRRIAKRLGETKIMFAYVLYDLLSPLTRMLMFISRRIKAPSGIWIQDL